MPDSKSLSVTAGDTPLLLPRLICLILAAVGSAAIVAVMRGAVVDSPLAEPSSLFVVSPAEQAVVTFALQANGLHTWVAAALAVVSLLLAIRVLMGRRNNTGQRSTAKATQA